MGLARIKKPSDPKITEGRSSPLLSHDGVLRAWQALTSGRVMQRVGPVVLATSAVVAPVLVAAFLVGAGMMDGDDLVAMPAAATEIPRSRFSVPPRPWPHRS